MLLFGQMEHRLLVWFDPDRKKSDCYNAGTCGYILPRSPTPGYWNSQTNEARRVACHCKMWSARSRVWLRRGWFAFHIFNPAIMIVHNMSILMPVVYSNHLYEVANHLDCATIVILLQKWRPRADILRKHSVKILWPKFGEKRFQ